MNRSDTQAPSKEQFTCVICKGTFDKGWSDDEAKEELANTFPGFTAGQCVLICDDCFKEL
jgi:hypothetical protein